MLLAIVDLMEQELMIENVLKAQGFADAVFFKNSVASVMVKQAEPANGIRPGHRNGGGNRRIDREEYGHRQAVK